MPLQSRILHDETNILEISGANEITYLTPTTTDFKIFDSSENIWPTPANPDKRYKYFSVELYLERDIILTNRRTEGLLDWIGDCGGLLRGLNVATRVVLSPYSLYLLESKLTWFLLLFIPSASSAENQSNHV